MLDLSLEYCRYCEEEDITFAHYKGKEVKAFSKNHLKTILVNEPEILKGILAYVYDDDGKLVENGFEIGYVTEDGEVMMLNSWYCDCYLTDDDRRKYKQSKPIVKDIKVVEEPVRGKRREVDVFEECFDTSWIDSILFVSEAKG